MGRRVGSMAALAPPDWQVHCRDASTIYYERDTFTIETNQG